MHMELGAFTFLRAIHIYIHVCMLQRRSSFDESMIHANTKQNRQIGIVKRRNEIA